MALICWYCGAKEGEVLGDDKTVKIDVLCHHCGKPLCETHRFLNTKGGKLRFFTILPEAAPAYHCKPCQMKYHSLMKFLMRKLAAAGKIVKSACVFLYSFIFKPKPSEAEPEPKKG